MAEFSTRKITPTDAVKIPAVNENLANPSGYMEADEFKSYATAGLATSADMTAADTGIRGTSSAYDSTATYSEGDFCIYSNVLYQANQDIETAEEWTAAHWDAVDLTTLKAGVDTNAGAITSLSDHSTTETLIGKDAEGNDLYRMVFTGNLSTAHVGFTRISYALNSTNNKLRGATGFCRNTNNNSETQIGCYLNANYYCGVYMSDSIFIYHSNELDGQAYYLALDYIKISS